MRYDLFAQAFGMENENIKDGVYAYGKNSIHQEFCFVAEVYDEEGNKKLIAYPKCVMSSAPKSNITNGSEEVTEVEIQVSLMADELGNVKYESMDDSLASQWMTNFSNTVITRG